MPSQMHEFSDEFSSRVQCGPRRCKEILNIYVLVNNYGHHLLFRKESEKIPDSVSDAASNYALDEVLSKYKDSAVNAENTVKQESTVTDKLDKILTTKWNIPRHIFIDKLNKKPFSRFNPRQKEETFHWKFNMINEIFVIRNYVIKLMTRTISWWTWLKWKVENN